MVSYRPPTVSSITSPKCVECRLNSHHRSFDQPASAAAAAAAAWRHDIADIIHSMFATVFSPIIFHYGANGYVV